MSDVYFRGAALSACGAVIEARPSRELPARAYESVQVPGRNGLVLFDEGMWGEVEQAYSVYLRGGFNAARDALAAWLYGQTGFGELWDTFDADHVRQAYFASDVSLTDVFDDWGRGELTFTCKPQRWLKSAMSYTSVAASQELANPYAFTARPIVHIEGEGAAVKVAVTGTQESSLTVSSVPASGLYIDSELMDAYDGAGANCNSLISGDWPLLGPGTSTLTVRASSGSVTTREVMLRWWTL